MTEYWDLIKVKTAYTNKIACLQLKHSVRLTRRYPVQVKQRPLCSISNVAFFFKLCCSLRIAIFLSVLNFSHARKACLLDMNKKMTKHTQCYPITWQCYTWMARYALNTRNNLIKGITPKKLLANMHIYSVKK